MPIAAPAVLVNNKPVLELFRCTAAYFYTAAYFVSV